MSSSAFDQSNNSNREFFNSLGGIVWRMDMEKHSLTQINNVVFSLLGYTADECLRERTLWNDSLHKDDQDRLNRELLQGITFYDTVVRRRRKDGSWCWLREIVNIVGGERGQPTLTFGISLDAASVAQQRDESNLLLDSVPAEIYYKDLENRIMYINKSAADSLGKTSDEISGKSCWELFPEEADAYWADDLSVINSGLPKISIIEPLLTATGEKKWVQTDKIPCRDNNGELIGILCFVIDITENIIAHDEMHQAKQQAEHSLRESEERLESLAKHMPGLIYQFVLKEDGSTSLPYVSESCRILLEFEPEELKKMASKLIETTIHEDDQPTILQAIQDSARTMDVFKFEGRVVTRTGKTRWVQASSTPSKLQNGDILWNGMMMDISDLKAAQEKIKHLNQDLAQRVGILAAVNRELELLTHKLEVAYDQALQASRLKSEFVANISHEVRTPISAVIGMSDLLLDTALTDEQKQFAKIVRESAESLLTIINDILDFSKIEAGKIELESIEFSISSILESCAELLSSTARRKKLELITEIDPSIPEVLSGDPVRIRQILLNLASNAIKFTEHGEVTLRAVQTTREAGRTNVKIEVSDTGIGISEEARRLLFQPFVQADGSTTRRYGGTGLGLSICKNLVELMGGEIGVSSSVGHGSTFWFTVPFMHKFEQPEEVADLSTANVLVVDEGQATRIILENYLTSAMVRTTFATTHAEVIEKLNRAFRDTEPFNIILINLANESIDAFELARYILESPTLAQAKIVFLTSFDEREKINSALAMGVSACLTKPIRQSQLLETLRAFCTGNDSAPLIDQPMEPVSTTVTTRRRHFETEKPVAIDLRCYSDKPILLAEDNPVMQELGVRQLTKMGVTAHAVSTGREVVDAIKSGDYALILMDCQMPEMDGFEATRTIRQLEKSTGKHIPIIAMTASAMRGDRENCIAAGMDDYMSKPVGKQQLISVLERWLGSEQKSAEVQPVLSFDPGVNDPSAPLDVSKLSELYGEQGIPEILSSFMAEGDKLLKSIKHHLGQHDDKDLATEAHQLKGLSAVMTIENMEKLSQELERAAKQSSWDQAEEIYKRLDSCFDFHS